MEEIRNTYRLLTGKHTRFVNGEHQSHASGTPTALMHNLSYVEVVEHKHRIELVKGTPPTLEDVEVPTSPLTKGGSGTDDGGDDNLIPPTEEEIENYKELLSATTASEVISLIDTMGDIAELRSMRACERVGKERTTVLKAIDAQIVKVYAAQKKEKE